MRVFGALMGPLAFSAGVWAAAGSIAPATADAAAHRFAVPASVGWWVSGLAVGWLLAPLRRHPLLATPALVSLLPWLPVPLPWFVQIWTGAWAWLPVGLTMGAAAIAWRPDRSRPARAVHPLRSTLVAGTVSAVLGAAVWISFGPRLPAGDEPHYLVITQSLLSDGDLQIENNHRARDYSAFADGDLVPHSLRRGTNDALYSVHAPGLPVLVAPLFALAGYRGAWVTVLALASIAGALIWRIGWEVTRDRSAAWFAWAATTTSVTFLALSSQVFPDVPGAACAAAGLVTAVLLAQGRTLRGAALVGVSVALSILPFLHSRFVVMAAGLGALIVWQLLSSHEGTALGRRRAATFLAVPTIAALAWFGYFLAIYGTVNPSAPYGEAPDVRLRYVPGGIAGLLFDQQFGLLTYSPVLAAAVYGWVGRGAATFRVVSRVSGVVLLAYMVAVSTYWMWWAGGPATPARLLTAALPLAVPALAAAWSAAGGFHRSLLAVLLTFSGAMSIGCLLAREGALAWNSRGIEAAWLAATGPAANIARTWPSFFWGLTPGDVSSQVLFFSHALCWVVVFAGAAWGLGTVVRVGNTGGSRLRHTVAAAWWLPIGLTMMAALAPSLTGARGLEPASAQLEVLSLHARGSRVVEIGTFHVSRVTAEVPAIRVAVREPGTGTASVSESAWMSLRGVPAGRYEIVVRARRPLGGEVVVSGAGADERFSLAPTSEQRLAWTVAENAAEVVLTLDPVLVRSRPVMELVPLSLMPAVQ